MRRNVPKNNAASASKRNITRRQEPDDGANMAKKLLDKQPPVFSVPDGFTIERMQPEDYETAVHLSSEAFTSNNPIVKHLGISAKDWKTIVMGETPKEEAIKHSFVARRDTDGNIAAYLTLQKMDIKRLAKTPPNTIKGFDTIKESIESLYWMAMTPGGLSIGPIVSGRTLHVANGGTNPGIGRKGLGKALRSYAVKYARDNGFAQVVVEPGHPATCHIWVNRLKFRKVAELLPSTIIAKDGSRPLKGIPDEVGRVWLCEHNIQENKRCTDSRCFWLCNVLRLFCQAGCGCC